MRIFMLLMISVFLSSCAVQEDNNYSLTPDEMKTAGNASINPDEKVASLYAHADYIKQSQGAKK